MHHVTGNVRQPEIAAAVAIGQLRMIEAHQMKNGGMQVVNVNGFLHCLEAEIIGRAVNVSALDAAARPAPLRSRGCCGRGRSAPSPGR